MRRKRVIKLSAWNRRLEEFCCLFGHVAWICRVSHLMYVFSLACLHRVPVGDGLDLTFQLHNCSPQSDHLRHLHRKQPSLLPTHQSPIRAPNPINHAAHPQHRTPPASRKPSLTPTFDIHLPKLPEAENPSVRAGFPERMLCRSVFALQCRLGALTRLASLEAMESFGGGAVSGWAFFLVC